MKHELSRQILGKYVNIKFNENPSNGSRVIQSGRTDGLADKHDEANSRFSQFTDRA
jgi:hypothetical protein